MSTLIEDVIALRRSGAIKVNLQKAAADGLPWWSQIEQAATKDVVKTVQTGPRNLPALLWKPLLGLALGAGYVGATKLWEEGRSVGVEDEVVRRYRDEYFMGGRRTQEEWDASGLEQKVRSLYRDVLNMAPDLGASAPAATAIIRPVAARPGAGFTDVEVKNIMDAQKASRETRPLGSRHLESVNTIFRMLPGAGPP